MSKRNILFTTTRQWNPGDEIILFGVLNLLRSIGTNFNPVIHNRHPGVNQPLGYWNPLRRMDSVTFPLARYLLPFLRIDFFDNSFKPTTDPSCIDLFVFAGSPEWEGSRLRPMYECIAAHDIPIVYLGIGGGSRRNYQALSPLVRQVLEKALLITTRDEAAAEHLAPVHPVRRPCPALFSFPTGGERQVTALKRIALIYTTSHCVALHRVTEKTYQYQLGLYRRIIETFGSECEIEIVCHYIDELPEAMRDFPGRTVHYDYDAKAYFGIYQSFDLVVGARVHGIGAAASSGVPGIALKHDGRGDTAAGFLAHLINLGTDHAEVIAEIHAMKSDIAQRSAALIAHKRQAFADYREFLVPKLAQFVTAP